MTTEPNNENTAAGVTPESGPQFRHGSQFQRLCRLARKEIVEILRDRRTIITLVLMPILVYPLMGVLVQKFLLNSLTGKTEVVFRIGFVEKEDQQVFGQYFTAGNQILNAVESAKDNAQPPDSADGVATEGDGKVDVAEEIREALTKRPQILTVLLSQDENIQELVATDQLDLGVVRCVDPLLNSRFEVYHNNRSSNSLAALDFVGRRVRVANDQGTYQFIPKKLKANTRFPGTYVETNVSSEPKNLSLLTFVPLMLVLMTITGAVYPAIDLTAGERERGTMEVLIAAPVSRISLLFGKFVAVLAVAMLTAIMNLIAMLVTVYALGLEKFVTGDQGLTLGTVCAILFLLFILASFFSATLLCLTSFARSFKEAQAYLIPLMLVAFTPGLLSLTPDIEMTPLLAIVPLVNVVLMGRDLLSGYFNAGLFTVTIVSTVIYGLLALSIAARVFGADSILTGGRTSWTDMFRRTPERQSEPTVSSAMLFLAVLFPAFIVIAGLSNRFEASIANRLIYNASITLGLFVLLPILFAVIFNLVKRSTFRLSPAHWTYFLAAVLLGASVWVFAYEIEILTVSESRLDSLAELFSKMKLELQNTPLVLKLFCLAIVPAVCEEFTFRGFLMSAFRKQMSFWQTIFTTAILFGLFHVFVRDAMMFERLLPSTLMGILLGFVCLRSGSLLPGILLHTLHNGLLISLAHYERELAEAGIGVSNQQHLPVVWILTAAVPALIGVLILSWRKTPNRQRFPDNAFH